MIARVKNNEINGGEALLEEIDKGGVKERPSEERNRVTNAPVVATSSDDGKQPNAVEGSELVEVENSNSSDEYETAESSGSEIELNNQSDRSPPNAIEPNLRRTRAGRITRPPARYGWD